jgi:hypothetical protein
MICYLVSKESTPIGCGFERSSIKGNKAPPASWWRASITYETCSLLHSLRSKLRPQLGVSDGSEQPSLPFLPAYNGRQNIILRRRNSARSGKGGIVGWTTFRLGFIVLIMGAYPQGGYWLCLLIAILWRIRLHQSSARRKREEELITRPEEIAGGPEPRKHDKRGPCRPFQEDTEHGRRPGFPSRFEAKGTRNPDTLHQPQDRAGKATVVLFGELARGLAGR